MNSKVCGGYCGNGNKLINQQDFDGVWRTQYNPQEKPCLSVGKPCQDCGTPKDTTCDWAVCSACKSKRAAILHTANAERLEKAGRYDEARRQREYADAETVNVILGELPNS